MDKEEVTRLIEEKFQELLNQHNIPPDMVKQRHIGGGVRFIRAGLAASLPTSGEKKGACYFETDTNKLKIYNGTAWKEETFT